jgi:hypothetical protein
VRASFGRSLLRALVLTVALSALAWLVVGLVVDHAARAVVPWAAACAFAGMLLGRLAGRLVPRGRPESAAQAALAGMGARILATVGLAWAAAAAGVAPLRVFALVLAGLYLALLVLEVVEAVAEVRDASRGLPSPPSSSSHAAGPHGGADA